MAQYMAMAASVFSLLGPALKKKNSSATTHSVSGRAENSPGFSTGLATGLILGIFAVKQLQRRRIKEKVRVSFLTWLNEDERIDGEQSNQKSTFPTRQIDPSSLGEDSIMEVISNCNNTLTPNLFCSKITMRKGTRIAAQTSKGVEVYYILKGSAEFSITDDNGSRFTVKESIVLNPWTTRSIANNSKEDLIMLRITDAGDEETENNGNIVVEKIDHQGTIKTIAKGIKSSMQKIGEYTSKQG